jgi:hypothetical protein
MRNDKLQELLRGYSDGIDVVLQVGARELVNIEKIQTEIRIVRNNKKSPDWGKLAKLYEEPKEVLAIKHHKNLNFMEC